jgi:hypothetical protein
MKKHSAWYLIYLHRLLGPRLVMGFNMMEYRHHRLQRLAVPVRLYFVHL